MNERNQKRRLAGRNSRRLQVGVAVLLVSVFGSGCATRALWARKSYRPADEPHLQLARIPETGAVVVRYDEYCEKNKQVRPRAYCVFPSGTNAAPSARPGFIPLPDRAGLEPIPLREAAPATNGAAAPGGYAVATAQPRGFELWTNGKCVGRYELPVYRAAPLTSGWRVVLTPAAVAADAAIAGTCVLAIGMAGGPH